MKLYATLTKSELLQELDSNLAEQETARKTADEMKRLVHELQVHQLELEMQNRELRDTRELLESSRDRYANLYDLAPISYVTFDDQGCIQEINLTGAGLLNTSRSVLIGKPFIFHVAQRDMRTFLDHMRRCNEAYGSGAKVTTELSLATSAQEPLVVQLMSIPSEVSESSPASHRTIIYDLTQQKESEREREKLIQEQAARAEAQEANRRKDEFLAVLSHELRTPLQAILSWSEILQRGGLSSEKMQLGLETIHRGVKSQAKLIQDLLDVSRIISGKMELKRLPVSLPSVLENVLKTLQLEIQRKAIHLNFEKPSEPAFVEGDLARLEQVFSNLVSNAVKFTPRGGQIEICISIRNTGAVISVKDTGAGIAPEFLPLIFERFLQADSSTTRGQGGLGLGLTIVRSLIELHHGSVTAESPGKGQGATFTVVLPLSRFRGDKSPETPGQVPSENKPGTSNLPQPPQSLTDQGYPSLHGIKILLVDDESDARIAVAEVLENSGAEILNAGSTREALQLFETASPDILVSDIGMPGEDGFELLHRIRTLKKEKGGETPAIALSAYASQEDVRHSLQAGFQLHIAKPVEPRDLVVSVARLALGCR